MSRKILIYLLLIDCAQVCFSQNNESVNGRKFLKRVENNYINDAFNISNGKKDGFYNLNSKSDLEKLFFGDINAMVEFFVNPSSESLEGAYGFRIVQDSLDNYLLEIKSISNWKEIEEELEVNFPSKGISAERMPIVTKEEYEVNVKYNKGIYSKRNEERLGRYEVASRFFPVSQKFTGKLHDTVSKAIDNFKGNGRPAVIGDGYTVTFRCVVEDEVWTFTIQVPDGYIGNLTNICKQIIKDMEANSLDESKYTVLLDK
jgi:hypothetical protein